MPSEDLFLTNELKGKIYFLPVLRVGGNKSGDESAPLRPLVVWPPRYVGLGFITDKVNIPNTDSPDWTKHRNVFACI